MNFSTQSSFLENDENDQWSNHPGFIGGTWLGDIFTPKKNEKKRYNKAVEDKLKKYPLSKEIDCDGIDDTIGSIDKALTKNANSGSKERVINRESRALENRRIDFKDEWDKQDCSNQKLEEQAAEFDTNIQKMFNEANQKSLSRKTEDKTLTTVAIGVGALVIGVVTYVALKR